MDGADDQSTVQFVRDLLHTNRQLIDKVRQLVAVIRFYETRAAASAEKEIEVATNKSKLLAEVDALL